MSIFNLRSSPLRPVIRRARGPGQRAASRGFSLLEVLITLVILAIGLLGVAMMQMMSLGFTQSANHRTVATNLAYELLDLMRSNRLLHGQYAAITYASFPAAGTRDPTCDRPVVAGSADPTSNMARWRCEVRAALPEGEAKVTLPGNGVVQVDVRWADTHWDENDGPTTFHVESRL